MAIDAELPFPIESVPSPAYVVDLGRLEANLQILASVADRTGCRILLALKAFSMFSTFGLLRKYLHGVCASSPHEARLGAEAFGGDVHVYAPAYSDADVDELLPHVTHMAFNSFAQWRRFKDRVAAAGRGIECSLRINPEHSEAEVAMYDPCAPGSRLGIRAADFAGEDLSGISGLNFHALCEQNADVLGRVLAAVEKGFSPYFDGLRWINFGGGHHITREDYDIDELCRLIDGFRTRHGLDVILEPGEAVPLNAGYLVATVLDVIRGEPDIAVLDTSATAHMPDVLEMPYRPEVLGACEPGVRAYDCELAGQTCLAGDIIGRYSFDQPLIVGQRLAFADMAHYTMVKNTTFNGVQLPAIAVYDPASGEARVVRDFGYEDFKSRLS